MPLLPFNSVGGYSTGITATAVIDNLGNITGVGATFSGLIRANAGISAAGATFANDISVNSMTIGRGTANLATNIAIGASAYFSGTTGASNLAIGRNTLRLNQAGDFNTAIGDQALANNVNGRNNTAIGANALLNTTTNSWNSGFAEYNVAVGGGALQNNTTGSYNMSFGASSLVANTTGLQNVSIGTYSTIRNTTGSSNVAIGHQALGAGTGGTSVYTANVSIGANSLLNTFSAGYNVAIGDEVGYFNRTGASNTLIGRNALRNNLTGSENVAIGSRAGEFAGTAGQTLGSSNDSIFIGFQARSGNTTSSNEIVIGSDAVGLGSNTTVIGATSATSATIYGTLNAPSGISASGATFSGNIRLQNQEFISNTTNGRIDFMPAPAGSTHYGLSIDTTSWGFGPRLGTIRSSDNATNVVGILWDVSLSLANNTRFNFGSNGQNGVVLSDTGNDTIQFYTNVTTGTNSGAIAIVDNVGVNTANRAPGTTHTNPNLYIYRAGSARATDFIRFEHDGSTGYMISGGTSDIELMPGSGIVGVSGNIQVLQNQIYVTNNARSWFL